MFGIRLDSELEARLGKIAKRDNRSKAFLIREAIIRYVEQEESTAHMMESPKAKLLRAEKIKVEECGSKYSLSVSDC